MLTADHITKSYAAPRGESIHALVDASFTVAAGEVLGLLGPNGAGKTTLLRILATIIQPTAGAVRIDGIDALANPIAARRLVGFLSGNTRLYGRLTGAETLRYFGRLYGMTEARIQQRVEELKALLDMDAFIGRRCDSLSTGQLQRVNIARVMLHDPPVLILDEPTLGLDIMTSRAILAFIGDARDHGRAVIFSTHYMTEAELLCDRIALIHEGRIRALDNKEGLYAATGAGNLQDAFLAVATGTHTA